MQLNTQELVNEIRKVANPKKIILFGSQATGTANLSSDYDFLVVMPDGIHTRNTAKLLYREIKNRPPSDFVFVCESILEKYKDSSGYIYCIALKEGKLLYAAK